MKLPEALIRTMIGVHGDTGKRWIEEFPRLIAYCEARWSCRIQEPFELSFNFVAPVVFADGGEAVLKLGVPCRELTSEAETLRRYAGRGAVRLLGAETGRGILLLERLQPGCGLSTVADDREAVAIASEVLRQLYRAGEARPDGEPDTGGAAEAFRFPTTAEWARGFERLRARYGGGTGPLPPDLIALAERRFEELHATASGLVLLHGDLHHDNVLSSGGGWVAIDPKGVIGEREYGVLQFILNYLPDDPEARKRRIAERAAGFAERLDLDERRILAWGFCHSLLSAWWCLEDGAGDAEAAVKTAECFRSLGQI